MMEVNVFKAQAMSVECPLCHVDLDGLLRDPRGLEMTCDECDTVFKVASDAEVEVD